MNKWYEQAACKDMDLDLFFDRGRVDNYAEARAVCARCPVAEQCLAAALDEEVDGPRRPYGVRGGKSPEERRVMRKSHPDYVRRPGGTVAGAVAESRREQVEGWLAEGRTQMWIAERLGVSRKTVNKWVKHYREGAAA